MTEPDKNLIREAHKYRTAGGLIMAGGAGLSGVALHALLGWPGPAAMVGALMIAWGWWTVIHTSEALRLLNN